MPVRVFCYGSNVSTRRLRARTPSARVVAVARLAGHRLAFRKHGRDGSAKADAVASARGEDELWGVVYELSADDKQVLDGYEGLGTDYDQHEVTVTTAEGRELVAWTYRARPEKIHLSLQPFAWYVAHLLEGAREHGFPAEYVEVIANVPMVEDSRESVETRRSGPRPRIVSLLPSATEIVCRLGFRAHLVGRSHECDYPPSVAELPVCTRPRFVTEGTSVEIDRRVKDLAAEALSLYEVDDDHLAALVPQVIVTQTQCEVCAVSYEDVARATERLLGADTTLVSLEARSLTGIFQDIERVAAALGAERTGAALSASLRDRIARVREQIGGASSRPSVFCVEWLDPLMAAGNWIPELVDAAGGRTALGKGGEHAPWIDWEEVVGADPDAIVLMPCGFDIARTLEETELLQNRQAWRELRAVRERNVFVTDANQYFNRPGPRVVDSIEILAEILHPRLASFGHQGRGWRRLAQSNA